MTQRLTQTISVGADSYRWDYESRQWFRLQNDQWEPYSQPIGDAEAMGLTEAAIPASLPDKAKPYAPFALDSVLAFVAAARANNLNLASALKDPVVNHIAATPWRGRSALSAWRASLLDAQLASGTAFLADANGLVTGLDGQVCFSQSQIVYFNGDGERADLPLDPAIAVELSSDGQLLVSHRPTLTRMALLSPLPGTALIPGLALQKEVRKDERRTALTLTHPQWQIRLELDPDDIADIRPTVRRLEAMLDALPIEPETTASADDRDPIELIRRLGALRDAGVLNTEEFEAKKAELLREL